MIRPRVELSDVHVRTQEEEKQSRVVSLSTTADREFRSHRLSSRPLRKSSLPSPPRTRASRCVRKGRIPVCGAVDFLGYKATYEANGCSPPLPARPRGEDKGEGSEQRFHQFPGLPEHTIREPSPPPSPAKVRERENTPPGDKTNSPFRGNDDRMRRSTFPTAGSSRYLGQCPQAPTPPGRQALTPTCPHRPGLHLRTPNPEP
jgi:hypothetical protein